LCSPPLFFGNIPFSFKVRPFQPPPLPLLDPSPPLSRFVFLPDTIALWDWSYRTVFELTLSFDGSGRLPGVPTDFPSLSGPYSTTVPTVFSFRRPPSTPFLSVSRLTPLFPVLPLLSRQSRPELSDPFRPFFRPQIKIGALFPFFVHSLFFLGLTFPEKTFPVFLPVGSLFFQLSAQASSFLDEFF